MLRITGEGRRLALDPRILDPTLPDNPCSKVNRCISNVFSIYQQTESERSTQLIFCDQSTPGKDKFNVYDDIKNKLIAKGVKPEEIAFIHDATTDTAKEALFERVRKGEVRILLGSTNKMGVGTNVQDRLIATHDLDVPWRPSDLEQRAGRIVRQGNQNKKVKVYRYITKGTFDAYMWQLVESKQRFISQIMTSKAPVRDASDCDEVTLSYAEIKACATGNPLIKEKMETDNEVQRLQMEKASYLEAKADLEYKVHTEYPQQIKMCQEIIEKLEDAKMLVDSHTTKNPDGKENFSMEINGKIYTKPKEAGEALGKLAKEDFTRVRGSYKGMRLSMVMDFETHTPQVVLLSKITRRIPIAAGNPTVTIRRMNETLSNLTPDINYQKKQLVQVQQNLKIAEEALAQPFAKEELLQEKMKRAAELTKQITDNEDNTRQPVANTLEQEKRKSRIQVILHAFDPKWKFPDAVSRSFAFFACQLLKTGTREWGREDDRLAIEHLFVQGYAEKDVVKTMRDFSPSVLSEDSLKQYVAEAKENSAVKEPVAARCVG